jgi:hypothetical protein
VLRIRESDWKVLRELHQAALNRFCERVLLEIERARSDALKTPHERYLDVYEIVKNSDDELAACFNDLSRSTGIDHLVAYRARGLLTDEEFSRFSQETQEVVAIFIRGRKD